MNCIFMKELATALQRAFVVLGVVFACPWIHAVNVTFNSSTFNLYGTYVISLNDVTKQATQTNYSSCYCFTSTDTATVDLDVGVKYTFTATGPGGAVTNGRFHNLTVSFTTTSNCFQVVPSCRA